MDAWYPQLIALLQIVIIDVVLAGDNAVVVGMAASRLSVAQRKRVIFWGVVGAVLLRIAFAVIATELLAIVGLTLAGGILLLWVCWKMYREVVRPKAPHGAKPPKAGFWNALTQIIVADVSMSLDNVLAVAGAAKGHIPVLVIGLSLSVLLMGVVANWIARLLDRHGWIAWIGLVVILQVAIEMIWNGSHEVVCQFVPKSICEDGFLATMKSLLGLR
ncbi:MAG TPA: TerC family protein [Xanthobacteraceae bacterium]|nr:TerC family protein [Xanthobacteraceae bacterium]